MCAPKLYASSFKKYWQQYLGELPMDCFSVPNQNIIKRSLNIPKEKKDEF